MCANSVFCVQIFYFHQSAFIALLNVRKMLLNVKLQVKCQITGQLSNYMSNVKLHVKCQITGQMSNYMSNVKLLVKCLVHAKKQLFASHTYSRVWTMM